MTDTLGLNYASAALSEKGRLNTTFFIEGILSFASNLLFIGVFFYTAEVFHWGLVRNFLLASGQGAVYVVASLASQRVARLLGDRRLLIWANVALGSVCVAGIFVSDPAVLTVLIIAYVPLMALNWPVLEAASAANADPHTMSRRLGLYNLIWAGTGAMALAAQGTILKIDPRGIFFVPLVIHVVIVGLIVWTRGYGVARTADPATVAHPDPEPALLRQRTLALWLSRIALPSTYIVIYSVSALMPVLPAIKSLDPSMRTVAGSVWMMSRWVTFCVLGATVFWHTRPQLLLASAVLMLVAFVGVTAPLALPTVVAFQIVLGIALGLIYTASLYFGLVLSDASTEHAGYHEALIGLGQVLGPGAGALTQWRWPDSILAGVIAVSSLGMISVLAAVVAAVKARSRS
jgi:MFS family permease